MSDIDLNKVRRLDGGLLLVFRELLRTRRASTTAARLGLSQPAISHALNRLRDLFDDPLFVRRPHGFEPTRRALELAPRIEAMVELAAATLEGERAFEPTRSDRMFRLGAPEFVTALIGGSLINRLQERAPGVTFAVVHVAEEDAYRELRKGEIELALGRFGAARPGFASEALFDDVYAVVARQGHPTLSGALSEAEWRETGHIYAWSGAEVGSEPAAEQAVKMLAAVPQWLTVLMLVAATDAIATVPRALAWRHAERLGLQVMALPFTPTPITVSALRRAAAPDPGLDWFQAEVRAALQS